MMRRPPAFCFTLVSLCTVLSAPTHAQAATAPSQHADTEFQKLDAMMKFIRNRNARDYAITTPNGIDEAKYVDVGGIPQEKIVLVGHSWGSTLGLFMVKARPDLLHAFVGTGQVADPARNYAVAYDAPVTKAERLGEWGATRELKEIGPPPYSNGRGYGVQRKWSNLFEGADFFISSMLGLAFAAPGYSLRDVNDWLDGQIVSSERLVPQTSVLGAKSLGGELALPVFVIQGAEDFTTPTSLARSFVESIRAPRKAFVAIEGGGHFAVFMKPDLLLEELVARVLPLTTMDRVR